ncbi:hypothetical protein EAE96_004251 [Botrytis aclada]|nr:hypothetical protein EAE96_004251 [Botrytis aclada]
MRKSYSQTYIQSQSFGDGESLRRVRTFDSRQLFSDGTLVTPEDIVKYVKYDKDSGMSHLEYPEADFLYHECGIFTPGALVLAVDGSCPGNGTVSAKNSSFGVFFGPDSPLNTYDTITRPSGEKHTNNYSELMAMLHALELLRHHSTIRQWISGHRPLISLRIDVIIITDSKFVHDCLTSWLPYWLRNGFRTAEGKQVVNKDLLLRIHHMIELLSDDLDIQIWHVKRQHNQDADELANRALHTEPIHQAQYTASSSLQHFRYRFMEHAGMMQLVQQYEMFPPQKDFMKMHLDEIIMYLVMGGYDCKFYYEILFGPKYKNDTSYIMYRKLIRVVLYLSLDEPGHCSYPDTVTWRARSMDRYKLSGKNPRPMDKYEALKLQKWCIDNRLFSDGKRLTSLLELIHRTRVEFGLYQWM